MDHNNHFDQFDPAFDEESDEDLEDLAILHNEDDHDLDYPEFREKILGEYYFSGTDWYLIKWGNSPIIQSSWQNKTFIDENYKKLVQDWKEQKLLIAQGKRSTFDVLAFTKAASEVDDLEKGIRNLRRWKRQVKGVLEAIIASKVD